MTHGWELVGVVEHKVLSLQVIGYFATLIYFLHMHPRQSMLHITWQIHSVMAYLLE